MPPTPHLTCSAARPAVAVGFAPEWRTETAVLLARGIVADNALDRLPILADAVEEAGCDDPLILRHCRECGYHTVRCWVLTDVLDLPPVVEAPRLTEAEILRELELVTGRPPLLPTADPWGGRVPARVRVMRALPWVAIGLAGAFTLWANFSPPVTRNSQYPGPFADVASVTEPTPAR